MSLSELDLWTRGGALALLLSLAAVLLRDHRAALPARMALGLIAGIACNLIAEAHGLMAFPEPIGIALFMGQPSVSGFFWLFVRAWFDDEARFGWHSWLVLDGVVALSLANFLLWTPERGMFWPTDIAMHVAWLGLPTVALWIAWRGRESDLVEGRRRLRIGFVWVSGTALLAVNLVHFGSRLILSGGRAPWIPLFTAAVTLGVFAGLSYLVLGLRRADIFLGAAPPARATAIASDDTSSALARTLEAHMARARPWRDEGLTIAALAAQLGVQEYRLRRTINGQLGFRNFATFLNGYRLGEVKAALADPAQREVPILTIAMDAGFGSLATFNRAFRESEGTTPSGYRAASSARAGG